MSELIERCICVAPGEAPVLAAPELVFSFSLTLKRTPFRVVAAEFALCHARAMTTYRLPPRLRLLESRLNFESWRQMQFCLPPCLRDLHANESQKSHSLSFF